jgi:8-oxo-dGTP diphosphatase
VDAVTVLVDGANVMGSRPDGWWRDRAGAAVRLHADLVRVAGTPVSELGQDMAELARSGPEPGEGAVGWVLVLEGAARAAGLPSAADGVARPGEVRPGEVRPGEVRPGEVRVVLAQGSGDDAIVALVRSLPAPCAVVTADRELRRRCAAAGASVLGPGWLLNLIRSA